VQSFSAPAYFTLRLKRNSLPCESFCSNFFRITTGPSTARKISFLSIGKDIFNAFLTVVRIATRVEARPAKFPNRFHSLANRAEQLGWRFFIKQLTVTSPTSHFLFVRSSGILRLPASMTITKGLTIIIEMDHPAHFLSPFNSLIEALPTKKPTNPEAMINRTTAHRINAPAM